MKTTHMKKQVLTLLMLCFGGSLMAQDIPSSEVPNAVKNAFTKEFSNPRDVEWEKKGEYYNVEFEIGRNDHELWITPSGQIVRHKEELSSSELPAAIKNKISANHKGYRIDDVDKLTMGNKALYKVEIKNGQKEMDLIFDKDGKSYEKSDWRAMKL